MKLIKKSKIDIFSKAQIFKGTSINQFPPGAMKSSTATPYISNFM